LWDYGFIYRVKGGRKKMKKRIMYIFLGCVTFIFCSFGVVLPSYAGCDDAASYASNAESYASDAARYARKAYRADTLEEAQRYAKKAMRAAEDAESEASNAESACY
jgi:hypothetical protein